MEVIIQPDAQSAEAFAAQILLHAIREKPSLVLGLASGRTMEGVYAQFVRRVSEEHLPVSALSFVALDEYIGLSRGHPGSYERFYRERLLAPLAIQQEQVFLLQSDVEDPERECRAYEERLSALGGVDLQLLGIGIVGHIGFNEPLSSLRSRTRTKSLTPETRRQNAFSFGGEENVPKRAMTMGVGTILDSKMALLVATGEAKADILREAVEGPISSRVTASALQMHPRCVVIADEAAASKLQFQEYYRWSFANEPEWEPFR